MVMSLCCPNSEILSLAWSMPLPSGTPPLWTRSYQPHPGDSQVPVVRLGSTGLGLCTEWVPSPPWRGMSRECFTEAAWEEISGKEQQEPRHGDRSTRNSDGGMGCSGVGVKCSAGAATAEGSRRRHWRGGAGRAKACRLAWGLPRAWPKHSVSALSRILWCAGTGTDGEAWVHLSSPSPPRETSLMAHPQPPCPGAPRDSCSVPHSHAQGLSCSRTGHMLPYHRRAPAQTATPKHDCTAAQHHTDVSAMLQAPFTHSPTLSGSLWSLWLWFS